MNALDAVRNKARASARRVAHGLDKATGGRLTPNTVTITGVLLHIPIAVLIALDYFIIAAILLVIFGLFDLLDGELARLQKRASQQGMLLDASTDRMKEVLLYMGAAYSFAMSAWPEMAVVAVLACGASLSVSYVKAKGEAAIASKEKLSHHELNRLFNDGLARFEVRMAILVIGLLTQQLFIAVALIALLATYTVIWRLVTISRRLRK